MLCRRAQNSSGVCQELGSPQHTPRGYTPWHCWSSRVNPSAAQDGDKEFLPGTQQLPTLPRLFGCCCDHPGWEMPIGPHFQPGPPGLLQEQTLEPNSPRGS